MAAIFLIGVLVCYWSEAAGNPRFHALGVDASVGNMEGKEVRFGIMNSALWATATTAASNGSVNSMHDSFTPLGGLVPLLNIQLGEVVFGGVGSGLYGMLVFVVLAVFLAGLMVGRTPEYLGKKIESYDVKVSVLFVMVPVFVILGFTAWAVVSPWALSSLNNTGPHGLSEIMYAYSSGNRQQRQRIRRTKREHLLVQHHDRHRHALGPLLHDNPGDGFGRESGREKGGPGEWRQLPRFGANVRDIVGGHGLNSRSAHLLPRSILGAYR